MNFLSRKSLAGALPSRPQMCSGWLLGAQDLAASSLSWPPAWLMQLGEPSREDILILLWATWDEENRAISPLPSVLTRFAEHLFQILLNVSNWAKEARVNYDVQA